MARGKSPLVRTLDVIQKRLGTYLKSHGFKARGRVFNRVNRDGLTDIISVFMANADPPGTIHVPGLVENMYGLFTLNAAVYVPEIATHLIGSTVKHFAQEYDCEIRTSLAPLGDDGREVWWHIVEDDLLLAELIWQIESKAFPLFARYATRDAILRECLEAGYDRMRLSIWRPARIVCAVIHFERGEKTIAHRLLAEHVKREGADHPGHAESVRSLAKKLGLPSLDR